MCLYLCGVVVVYVCVVGLVNEVISFGCICCLRYRSTHKCSSCTPEMHPCFLLAHEATEN